MSSISGDLPSFEWIEPVNASCDGEQPIPAGFSKAVWNLVDKRFHDVAVSAEKWERFSNPRLAYVGRPFDMPGVEDAARRIIKAIDENGEILVFGDFDCDGVTATALLVDMIRACGGKVSHFIPVRAEGYGLSDGAVARALSQVHPSLFITVDCGMGAGEALQGILDKGIDVIVSDHHLPGAPLPKECIVVSTHSEGVPLECEGLCGAGVAFKIACGVVISKYPTNDDLGKAIRMRLFSWLDALAIATIADVVPLTGENRLIAQLGMERLSKAPRLGLKRLMLEVFSSEQSLTKITSQHIGFILAPHINAAGRISSAEAALALLLSEDADEARKNAIALKQANACRRSEDSRLEREAREIINAGTDFVVERDGAVVVAKKGWPAGVIGLCASHLSEAYNRPAVVFSLDDNGLARGSVRAPSGYNAYEALSECSGCIVKFGGHSGAAGLVIEEANLSQFREAFSLACKRQVGSLFLRPKLSISGWLDSESFDASLISSIHKLEPFGEGNPKPVWGIKGVEVKATKVGKSEPYSLQLSFKFKDGFELLGIWFHAGERFKELSSCSLWDFAGELMEDWSQGMLRLKLSVIDARRSCNPMKIE